MPSFEQKLDSFIEDYEIYDDDDDDDDENVKELHNILNVFVNGHKTPHTVNYEDKNGYTPLFKASRKGLYKVVKILLDHDAIVNMNSDGGESPLLVAAENGHDKVVELLLANGASVNKKDKYGRTPLSVAKKETIIEMIKKAIAARGGRRRKIKTNKKRKNTKRRKTNKK